MTAASPFNASNTTDDLTVEAELLTGSKYLAIDKKKIDSISGSSFKFKAQQILTSWMSTPIIYNFAC